MEETDNLRVCLIHIRSLTLTSDLAETVAGVNNFSLLLRLICFSGVIWPVNADAEDGSAFGPDWVCGGLITTLRVNFANCSTLLTLAVGPT